MLLRKDLFTLTLRDFINLSTNKNELFLQGVGYLKRAHSSNLHEIFNKYASVEKNGETYMTADDFIIKYLGLFPNDNYNEDSVKLFAGIVDTSKDGLISYAEFQAFEGLLCYPDALYKTAFQLFDTNGNGMVSFSTYLNTIIFLACIVIFMILQMNSLR